MNQGFVNDPRFGDLDPMDLNNAAYPSCARFLNGSAEDPSGTQIGKNFVVWFDIFRVGPRSTREDIESSIGSHLG